MGAVADPRRARSRHGRVDPVGHPARPAGRPAPGAADDRRVAHLPADPGARHRRPRGCHARRADRARPGRRARRRTGPPAAAAGPAAPGGGVGAAARPSARNGPGGAGRLARGRRDGTAGRGRRAAPGRRRSGTGHRIDYSRPPVAVPPPTRGTGPLHQRRDPDGGPPALRRRARAVAARRRRGPGRGHRRRQPAGRPGDEAGTRPRPRGRAACALPRRAGRGGVAGPQHRPARGPRRPRGLPGRRRGRGPDVARVRARGVGRRAGRRRGDRADPAHRAGDARPAARPGLRRLRQGLHPPHLRSRRAPSGAPDLPVPGGRLRLRRERRVRPDGDHCARWLRHPARSGHAHQGRGRPRRAAAHGARRPRDRLRARGAGAPPPPPGRRRAAQHGLRLRHRPERAVRQAPDDGSALAARDRQAAPGRPAAAAGPRLDPQREPPRGPLPRGAHAARAARHRGGPAGLRPQRRCAGSDRDDLDETVEPAEVVGIAGVQRGVVRVAATRIGQLAFSRT